MHYAIKIISLMDHLRLNNDLFWKRYQTDSSDVYGAIAYPRIGKSYVGLFAVYPSTKTKMTDDMSSLPTTLFPENMRIKNRFLCNFWGNTLDIFFIFSWLFFEFFLKHSNFVSDWNNYFGSRLLSHLFL